MTRDGDGDMAGLVIGEERVNLCGVFVGKEEREENENLKFL